MCFFLKILWFSELCQFCCGAGVLPAWCVYTHRHRGKTEKGQSAEYFFKNRKKTQYLMNTLYLSMYAGAWPAWYPAQRRLPQPAGNPRQPAQEAAGTTQKVDLPSHDSPKKVDLSSHDPPLEVDFSSHASTQMVDLLSRLYSRNRLVKTPLLKK